MIILKNSGKKKVYIIVGPTAIGKTKFAISLANELDTEIISADSRQCFKELSIGVAKPTNQELAQVPHHFIATNGVTEDINAAYFEFYALNKTEQIFIKNDSVIMVGGTGLYIKAFCEGIDPMPVISAEIRETIVQQYLAKGLIWLQAEIKHKDPAFWQIAEQQNPQRLMRGLEVFNATGKSITIFRSAVKKQRHFSTIKIGLQLPMEILTERINTRVDQMMEDGLIEEVKSVSNWRGYAALQTVGYKEIFDYLDGKFSLDEAVHKIKIHTRQYAKRQLTWFKKDEEVNWFDVREISVKSVLY